MHKGVCAFVAKLKLHLLTCMDYNWLYLSMSCDNQLWENVKHTHVQNTTKLNFLHCLGSLLTLCDEYTQRKT